MKTIIRIKRRVGYWLTFCANPITPSEPTHSVIYPEYTFWSDGIKVEWKLSVYMCYRELESLSQEHSVNYATP